MASLHDAMVYLAREYPYKSELSKARLTKMLYLADWRAAITNSRQITSLEWVFNHYGPYLPDVVQEARTHPDFEVRNEHTMYGSPKEVVALANPTATVDLAPWEKSALDHVIEQTKDLNWSQFIELVYSTYPIVSQDRYATLDLIELAGEYELLQATLEEA